ncbi:Uncharacterized protein FWK35_00009938 [Aphis craccivora]|uniref:Uncharacterized protein n=1 Tax=Aphis craccivora TaxID=307492 RepID=A0A6G0ZLJ0_APHCR|nr:Uncharacterized protein FWK35_00009938 [Aphis craccivora]
MSSIKKYLSNLNTAHSERSEECIDFTMIITSRNNASISNFGGGFRWKSEYPWCIIKFTFLRNMSKTRKFATYRYDLSSNDFKYFISRRYLKVLPFLIKYPQTFYKIKLTANTHISSKWFYLFID